MQALLSRLPGSSHPYYVNDLTYAALFIIVITAPAMITAVIRTTNTILYSAFAWYNNALRNTSISNIII